ncbi:MAG: START domain-containing protein [Moraxellaceae bacterium]|nr:START domain-containing protein [Moraxellaceae bacterium]
MATVIVAINRQHGVSLGISELLQLMSFLHVSRLISLLLVMVAAPAVAENWELARDRGGIKVWTTTIPDYPIRGFRAVTVVKSSLSGVVNLILDTDNAGRWAYRTTRIDVLSRNDEEGTFVIRADTDFPWPLTDRDVVLSGAVSQDEKTRVVTIRSISVESAQYPHRAGFVRMPDMEGVWVLRPLPGGQVEVSMTGRANPGGSIPGSIVNLIIHETPYMTLRGLREAVRDERYQRSVQPRIRELGE